MQGDGGKGNGISGLYLKQELVVEKTITFGSIEGSYDRIVEPGDANGVVKGVRSMFEPVKLVRRLTGKK